nr:hypothetical protein GCM10020092_034470 [Actinoplanes digitatis]
MSITGRVVAFCVVVVLAGCGAEDARPEALLGERGRDPVRRGPVHRGPIRRGSVRRGSVRSYARGGARTGGPARGTPAGGAAAGALEHGPRGPKRVALTFDADMTDAMIARLRRGAVTSYANLTLLGQLEQGEIPATFFVTGQWAEQYPQVMRRIAGNPRFEVANHSYEHAAFTAGCYTLPQLPAAKMTDDVARTFRTLEPFGG